METRAAEEVWALKLEHSIREQRLEIGVDSEALALQLQPRLADVNRRYFLPVIERVFDELDVPGQHIKIGTLKINLGRIPFASFEEDAPERLYRELRQALEEHLRGLKESSTAEDRWQSEKTSRLELLEHYLLTGTLPFWATHAATFSLEELMQELSADDPQGLAEAVRKHARLASVRERLVLQLREESLRRLLHVLEPEHAVLMIAYMIDLRTIYRVKPVFTISDRQLARLIWSLVLSYITQDPGSQFNRRSFLKSLLEGMCESQGLDYAELLKLLCTGLQETEKKHLLKSSLPIALRELEYELGSESAAGESMRWAEAQPTQPEPHEPGDESTALLLTDEALLFTRDSAQAALRESTTNQPARESAPDQPAYDEPLHEQTAGALASLELYLSTGQLPAVDGEDRKAGVSFLSGLFRWLAEHDASRARQLIWKVARLNEPGLSVLIFRLLQAFPPGEVLAVIAPGTRALIEGFVRVLSSVHARAGRSSLEREVEGDERAWESMLEYLLRESSGRLDLRGMVRQVMESVAWRIGLPPVALAEAIEVALKKGTEKDAAYLPPVWEEVRQYLRERVRQAREARPAFTRYDQAEILRYYFRYGVLPWGALARDPELTPQRALKYLPLLSRSLLQAVFSVESSEERLQALLRATRLLPEESLAELLRRLFHQAREMDSPFWAALSEYAEKSADKHSFYAGLIAANLDGRPIDLEELAAASSSVQLAGEPVTYADLTGWDAHAIKSALAHRLRFGDTSDAGVPTSVDLLRALVTTHPQDARYFLSAVRDTPDMMTALARQSPAPVFERLLDLVSPDGTRTLRALLRSLAGIAAPYRPASEEVMREVILYEALLLEEGKPLTDLFFARVLRKLFGASLPLTVTQFLLQETAGWSASAELPEEQVAALEAAIKSDEAWARGAASLEEPARDGARQAATVYVAPALREAVFAFLRGETPAIHSVGKSQVADDSLRQEVLSDDVLAQVLLVMLDRLPEVVGDFLHQHQPDLRERERWIKILPESALIRLSYLIEPQKHRVLLDSAEVLASAWLETVPHTAHLLADRESYWRFLFDFLARNAEADRTPARLVTAFFEYVAARYQALEPGDAARLSVAERLLEHARRLADEAGQSGMRAILHRDRALLLSTWDPNAPTARLPASALAIEDERQRGVEDQRSLPRRSDAKMAFSLEKDEKDGAADGKPIYINNAGLTLTGPFLPHLFKSLDLLVEEENGRTRLRDSKAVSRAVHLLQYLVDGSTSTPEPFLVLNKIMCGVPTAAPVEREIEPTEQERELCERLLLAMIANWKIIENTSIVGLQETFLQREGKLDRSDDGWKLQVQRKTLDVLVDQVPWSISVIFNKWMPQPLHVIW